MQVQVHESPSTHEQTDHICNNEDQHDRYYGIGDDEPGPFAAVELETAFGNKPPISMGLVGIKYA